MRIDKITDSQNFQGKLNPNVMQALDKIAKEYSLIIEYINILELVDSEKEVLTNSSDIFNETYYPHLVIIKNGKIISDSNDYLNGNEIKKTLKK